MRWAVAPKPEALDANKMELHERARQLAKKQGAPKTFVDAVDQVVDRLRRKDDPPLIVL